MLIDASIHSASTLSKVEWVDTHAHLNFTAFDKDRDEVIKKCLENNVWMLNVGTNYETSKKAKEIAKEYPRGVYAAVGLHPININQKSTGRETDSPKGCIKNQSASWRTKFKNIENILEEEFDYKGYRELAKSEKIVAIGEIGLDYWYRPKTKKKLELFKQKQKELLAQEIKLAQEMDLPIIFHCRLAHDDLIQTIKQFNNLTIQGVIHCFTGTWEQAEKFLELGLYLGFNGIIFKLDLDEVIKKVPLDRILIETDCPYLTPPGFKEERNNPLGVKLVAEHIAKIKDIGLEEAAKMGFQNAKKLFNIGN